MSLASVSQAQSKEEARRTIDRLLNVALPMSTAALGPLGLLGVPVLYAFYSEQFTTSAGLLPWILCADLVVVVAWVVGAPLLAFGDRAIWLVLELVVGQPPGGPSASRCCPSTAPLRWGWGCSLPSSCMSV